MVKKTIKNSFIIMDVTEPKTDDMSSTGTPGRVVDNPKFNDKIWERGTPHPEPRPKAPGLCEGCPPCYCACCLLVNPKTTHFLIRLTKKSIFLGPCYCDCGCSNDRYIFTNRRRAPPANASYTSFICRSGSS